MAEVPGIFPIEMKRGNAPREIEIAIGDHLGDGEIGKEGIRVEIGGKRWFFPRPFFGKKEVAYAYF